MCHRRFQQWQRDATLTRLLHASAEDLRARGKLDLSDTFIDATFSSAKKGALLSARLAAEKAVKSWRSKTAGLPIACSIASASPHETRLVEPAVKKGSTRTKPKRMIGDRANDSDPLDQGRRQRYRIRLIAPHFHSDRKRTQDGRELRRYCRR
jgi:hypothetical protein